MSNEDQKAAVSELDQTPCCVSSGIHDGLTFGRGKLDYYGYWEFPDYEAAREHEAKHPEDGECWPFAHNVPSSGDDQGGM